VPERELALVFAQRDVVDEALRCLVERGDAAAGARRRRVRRVGRAAGRRGRAIDVGNLLVNLADPALVLRRALLDLFELAADVIGLRVHVADRIAHLPLGGACRAGGDDQREPGDEEQVLVHAEEISTGQTNDRRKATCTGAQKLTVPGRPASESGGGRYEPVRRLCLWVASYTEGL
jgi:hypothetical protein